MFHSCLKALPWLFYFQINFAQILDQITFQLEQWIVDSVFQNKWIRDNF